VDSSPIECFPRVAELYDGGAMPHLFDSLDTAIALNPPFGILEILHTVDAAPNMSP